MDDMDGVDIHVRGERFVGFRLKLRRVFLAVTRAECVYLAGRWRSGNDEDLYGGRLRAYGTAYP